MTTLKMIDSKIKEMRRELDKLEQAKKTIQEFCGEPKKYEKKNGRYHARGFVSPVRDKIVSTIEDAPFPLTHAQIAKRTGFGKRSVYTTVWRLLQDKDIKRVDRGLYGAK